MGAWKYAFSLSKEELKDATPPGTVRLIGSESPPLPTLRAANPPRPQ